MFFEIWVLWGDAKFFALFAVFVFWASELFAAWLDFWLLHGPFLLPRGWFCVPREYLLSTSCRSGVILRPQEPFIAKILKKYET